MSRDVTLPAGWSYVIGLEVHVQLLTRTKAFCGCSTDFGAAPNAHTCPVCLALPGALPVLNREAVELAVRAALAIGATVHETSVFARKNYFYPDLPKGYQISQFDRPLATGGAIDLPDGPRIGITRLHMEEDAGKSVHDKYAGATAIDLNRAGVPLAEIVSEPDLRTPADAGAYLRALKQVLEYTGVSDCSMEEGSLRVDANVSVRREGETGFRTKTEIKNMNSFSGVERAIEAEARRQVALYEAGGAVEPQTMLWDAARGEVRPARAKEGSHDYRYFPEPDLPPLVVTAADRARIAAALPELPAARRARFVREWGVAGRDAEVLCADRLVADYFEAVARAGGNGKAAANWVTGEVLAHLNATGTAIAAYPVTPQRLADLIALAGAGTVSASAGKQVLARMLDSGDAPAAIAEREGLVQVQDDSQLVRWIDEVLAEHPAEAARFLGGERKLQGVLVGFVMKKSKGSADPRKLNQLLGARAGG
ncbi:MAG: Asp-tRNA(Asn)/Glu-tRNA(Gln) amidotransferase subunit GatB [Gemmatimonadota bacterium]|jgi:aspartyl-tRNA(Asn)/glutamyl-tRNA(Gln) amidotransferase subunit B|nr:Asp-tRNA(Asn)/Glu-tRNA(Gln) amidotransferase subunit GatB [Gemmatimonadota bacterium]